MLANNKVTCKTHYIFIIYISESNPNDNYQQKFLQEDTKECKNRTADQFLEECTYRVDLKRKFRVRLNQIELYHVKSTCVFHEGMPYSPVQLRILPDVQKLYNGAKFMLQVWNDKTEKIYEKALQSEVTKWNIFYQYLIFKPDAPEENHQYYHFVNLEKGGATYLINDFTSGDTSFKYLAFNDSTLTVASSKEIVMAPLEDKLEFGETRTIDINRSELINIKLESNIIHGLFMNKFGNHSCCIVAIETLDNQIDFNYLLNSKKQDGSRSYQLKQFRQHFPRNPSFDPIIKFVNIYQSSEYNYSVAVRQSKKFDLYFNSQLMYSSGDVTVIDADISFGSIYLRLDRQTIKSIQLSHNDRISLENAESESDINFMNIFYSRIKNSCKLFTGFCLIRSYMVIAHGNILSQVNIVKKQSAWMGHIAMDCEIKNIYRIYDGRDYPVCVILKDGQIRFMNTSKIYSDTPPQENTKRLPIGTEYSVLDKELKFQIQGQLLLVIPEKNTEKFILFLSKLQNDMYQLQMLHMKKLIDISHLIPQLGAQHNFVFLFQNQNKQLLVVQNNKAVTLCEILIDQDMNVSITKLNEFNLVSSMMGQFHSGMLCQQCLILMDAKHIFSIHVETSKGIIYRDANVQGMFYSDDKFCYALAHKSQKFGHSGLRLFDIHNSLKAGGQDLSYLLTKLQVGCQAHIDYSAANQRIVFQSSFDSIEIIPLLHRNTIFYFGMQWRGSYLAGRVLNDKFTALSINNKLTTWDKITGKLKMEWPLENNETSQDYSGYDIFKCDDKDLIYKKAWYSKILIKAKVPLKDYDENIFFDPQHHNAYLENQQSYIQGQKKEFYELKLIEIINEKEVKEHLSFIHPFYNRLQYIYFSEDCEYMIEQLVNYRIFIYKKVALNNGTNRVQWQQVHKFESFPNDLFDQTQFPVIFTPDFTKYVDIDRLNHTFLIRDSFTQAIITRIPENLMNSKSEDIKHVINRFAWIDNFKFKIVSSNGIERIVDIRDNFKEIEFNVIPMYDSELCKKNNIILDIDSLKITEPLQRLIRKYQKYKSTYYLDKTRSSNTLYDQMFTVDYGINICRDRFVGDLSFTFLHWRMIEELDKGQLNIQDLGNEQIELLFYNILPGGETVLHKLISRSKKIEEMFQMAQPDKENRSEIKYHIPFLPNVKGQSPLHLLANNKDFKTMNIMLDYLSGYSFDHHSRAINSLLPLILSKDLSSLPKYLDSRLQQTDQTKQIKRGVIVEDSEGVVASSFWFDSQELGQLLMQNVEIESQVLLKFIDIPNMHSFVNDHSEQFFEALASTDNLALFDKRVIQKLIEFKWPLVREFTIRKLFKPYVAFLLVYLFYMNLFYLYRNGIENDETHEFDYQVELTITSHAISVILLGFSFHFLSIEIRQMSHQGFSYLMSFWNYLDVIPFAILIVFLGLEASKLFDSQEFKWLEGSLQATMSLMIWLKFLYFLRIFKETGFLIRIILDVIKDMRYFLLILLLTVTAFGDSMYQLSSSNKKTEIFVHGGLFGGIGFVYRMLLGDFDTKEFGFVNLPYVWTLFLLSTVLNMIIMLNLLIAIISQSFEKINSVSLQASYQERACIIAENAYLITDRRRKKYCEENKYLLLAIDIEQEQKEEEDSIDSKLVDLKQDLIHHISHIEKKLAKKVEENQLTLIEQFKTENKVLHDMLKTLTEQRVQ